MNIDELKLKIEQARFNIDWCKTRMKRLSMELQEYSDESESLNEELDRLEIKEIIDKPFDTKLQYFFDNYNNDRSDYHINKCWNFFNVLHIAIIPSAKTCSFLIDKSFINTNRSTVEYILPQALEYSCTQRMDGLEYKLIFITNHKTITRVAYYPATNEYWTDGNRPGSVLHKCKDISEVVERLLED